MAPESAQKITNAAVASATEAGSNSRLPKSRPAKTSRFFVHWSGRSEIRRLKANDRPDTVVAGVPETAMEEGAVRATRAGDRLHLGRCRKTPDRVALGVERFKHGQQLRDRQQIGDPFRQVQQLHAAALAADGRVRADDLPEAGAVHVWHVCQIQDDLSMPLIDEAVYLVLQEFVTLPQRDLALEVEHDHVPYVSFLDLHENAPDVCAVSLTHPVREAVRCPPARTGLVAITVK